MPMKNAPRMTAIHISVVEAFLDSGFLKAGMPLEIASTPVRAAQPEAKARRTMNQDRLCVPAGCSASGMGARRPGSSASRTKPPISSIAKAKMNIYVGIAKMVPDSRMPRRLRRVMMPTTTTAISTLRWRSSGIADVMAKTPAAIDTATVRM